MIKLIDLLKEEFPSANPVTKSDIKILFYRSSQTIAAREGDKEVIISSSKESRNGDVDELVKKINATEGDFKLTDGRNEITIPKDAKYYFTGILKDKTNFYE